MPLWLRICLLSTVGFSLGFGGIYLFMNRGNELAAASDSSKPVNLDWAALRELDLSSGKMSNTLKSADGKKLKSLDL